MCPTTTTGVIASRRERGASLIEGMVAILIFSLGILAIISMHAASIRHTTDAQFRSEAAYLANGVLARIRMADQKTVATDFASPSGAQFTQWLTDVAAAGATLPGMDVNPPTIVFAAGQVTVTVRWQAQSDSGVHRHVVETQLD